ncbi:MAG: CoA transferase, partial [Proteobacteria bacterium]|nr:CoA transferase [Pseudomonadota bacterium]
MSRPLDDVVVLDLTRLFCTSLSAAFLADFGARVVRLELLPLTTHAAEGWNCEADLI